MNTPETLTLSQWAKLNPEEQKLYEEAYQVRMKFNENWTDCDDVLEIIPYTNDPNREWRKVYKLRNKPLATPVDTADQLYSISTNGYMPIADCLSELADGEINESEALTVIKNFVDPLQALLSSQQREIEELREQLKNR